MPFQNPTNLEDLSSNSLGISLSGLLPTSGPVFSVAMGDFNADGLADMIIGMPYYNQLGKVYVIFGSRNPVNIANLDDLKPPIGLSISNDEPNSDAGISLAVGDVNGDGKDDILIGVNSANDARGKAYVVFGSLNPVSIANLSDITLPAGVVFNGGTETSANTGVSVAMGDINGDSKKDCIIGANNIGKTYIVFGSNNITSIDNLDSMQPEVGIILNDNLPVSSAGWSVASGDINGDSKDDVIIGAPNTNSNQGIAYVVFGSEEPASISNIANMTMPIGISIGGADANYSWLGRTVAAGDINGDNRDEILIEAFDNALNQKTIYVIFGSTNPSSINNLATISQTQGIKLIGEDSLPAFVSSRTITIGDINGDGFGDAILGAPNANNTNGLTYVVFGNSNPVSISDLNTLTLPTGFVVNNSAYPGNSGFAVAAGDVNGDGKADMLIGARPQNGTTPTYLVYGGPMPEPITTCEPFTALDELGKGAYTNTGFQISGTIASSGVWVWTVSLGAVGTGDINGDGRHDIFLAALGNSTHIGKVYVVFGGNESINIDNLEALEPPAGVIFGGTPSPTGTGRAVIGMASGDINGDGYEDILIGADTYNNNQGSAYVVYGSSNPVSIANLTELAPPTGIVLSGAALTPLPAFAGYSVAVSDINGDGKADMLISAPNAEIGQGKVYVVFGSENPQNVNNLDNMTLPTGIILEGVPSGSELSLSLALGDINGDSKADMVISAPGGQPTTNNTVYIVFGSDNPSSINNLDNMLPEIGISLYGMDYLSELGRAVAVGDINGDKKDDVLICAPGIPEHNNNGTVYVVFGTDNPTSINNLYAIEPPVGMVLSRNAPSSLSGCSVAVGDVNGDGKDDIVITSRFSNSGADKTYVIFGSENPQNIKDIDALSPTAGFILTGQYASNQGSFNVSYSSVTVGDINGDGKGDIIIGAPMFNSTTRGMAYVVYGNETPWLTSNSNSSIYTKNMPFTVINPTITLDEESAQIISATIQITGNYQANEDFLKATELPKGITALPFDTTTGTLSLNGTASAYDYQTALENIAYINLETRVADKEIGY